MGENQAGDIQESIIIQKKRIHLLGAIVRSTLPNALRAKICTVGNKHTRTSPISMSKTNTKGKMAPALKKTPRQEINTNHKQPTVTTWPQKLAVAQHLRQTTAQWQIRKVGQLIIEYLEQQRQEQWGGRKLLLAKEKTTEQKSKIEQYLYYQQGEQVRRRIQKTNTMKNHRQRMDEHTMNNT